MVGKTTGPPTVAGILTMMVSERRRDSRIWAIFVGVAYLPRLAPWLDRLLRVLPELD